MEIQNMCNVMVAGAGTDVGKTIVSAILTTLLDTDYWKPIQCGNEENSDTTIIKNWIDTKRHFVHSPAYSLKAPLSPHHAARLENTAIALDAIRLPQTERSLVIEGIGGVFVPLTKKILSLDLFKSWNCKWVVVSRHYVGSINHTLLTIEALKQQQVPIIGIIFNGEPNPDSEEVISEMTQLPCLGRLFPEENLNPLIIQSYAKKWQPNFLNILQ